MGCSKKQIMEYLRKEEQRLRKLIDELEGRRQNDLPGTLHVSTTRGSTRYYHVTQKSEKAEPLRRYLGNQAEPLAKQLAQQEYETKLLQKVRRQYIHVQSLLKSFEKNDAEQVYERLSEERKKLVQPLIPDKEMFMKKWQEQSYQAGTFREDAVVILTERGERVRSKTEKIMADKYYKTGIPYRYEYPVQLLVNGRVTVFRPDFMLLNINSCEVFYHEHFGMMDDPVYCENALRKLNVYADNGIIPGENLLVTYETRNMPVDLKHFEQMIHRYLLQ